MHICVNHKTCNEKCDRKYPFIVKHLYRCNSSRDEKIHFYCLKINKETYHVKYHKPRKRRTKK